MGNDIRELLSIFDETDGVFSRETFSHQSVPQQNLFRIQETKKSYFTDLAPKIRR